MPAPPDVFQAIADPVRRRILELLSEEERPAGELVGSFDMTFGAISQHLKVLRDAGLVSRRKEGRRRIYTLQTEPLKRVHDWTALYERAWRGRLDGLRTHLARTRHE